MCYKNATIILWLVIVNKNFRIPVKLFAAGRLTLVAEHRLSRMAGAVPEIVG